MPEKNTENLGGLFVILAWVTLLVMMWLLFNNILYQPKNAELIKRNGEIQIILTKDRDSHYRIKGTVNGVPVTFLVDTGASLIMIPGNIAKKANLPFHNEVVMNTASGKAKGFRTKIDHLILETIDFGESSAVVNPNLYSDEALLGMNVIQHLDIIQSADKLILKIK